MPEKKGTKKETKKKRRCPLKFRETSFRICHTFCKVPHIQQRQHQGPETVVKAVVKAVVVAVVKVVVKLVVAVVKAVVKAVLEVTIGVVNGVVNGVINGVGRKRHASVSAPWQWYRQ